MSWGGQDRCFHDARKPMPELCRGRGSCWESSSTYSSTQPKPWKNTSSNWKTVFSQLCWIDFSAHRGSWAFFLMNVLILLPSQVHCQIRPPSTGGPSQLPSRSRSSFQGVARLSGEWTLEMRPLCTWWLFFDRRIFHRSWNIKLVRKQGV